MKRESVPTVDMADGSSTLPGRRAARASLFSLFVQVLCIAHPHTCSGDQTSRELATAAALLSSATSFTTRVVIRNSPSITQPNVLGRGPQNTLEATRTSSPTISSHTLLESTNEPAGSGSLEATYTFTTENGLARRSVPHKQELESVAKESDTLLETNEVSVSNTAGRYFEIIRPTRTTSGAAEGILNVPVTSSENSGEEKGASPSGGVRPQTTTTKRNIATPMDIARESTAQDEEKSLVTKIWLIAESTSNQQHFDGGFPHARALEDEREWEYNAEANNESGVSITPWSGSDHATGQSEERKANPDIQDIITGIVKLLNGNVKVQANTNLAGGLLGGTVRPARPMPTRINNRGPPRITDLPPLPPLNLDASADLMPPPLPADPPRAATASPDRPTSSASTHLTPPYLFDRPHLAMTVLPPQPNLPPNAHPFVNGVPLPELVVPMSGGRPSMRPRPPQRLRPGSNKRPPSLLPPLSARPLPEDVSVVPVPFDTFELLPSTGTRDDGEGSDLGDVALPDAIVEAEGSSELVEDNTTQKEDFLKVAQTLFPQPKPEKDSKKPMELIKEKDAPAKASLGVVSTASFKISSPIPTVVAMDITTFGHYSTEFTSDSEEKESTSASATTTITTTTSTASATTTTEEQSSIPEKLASSPTPPPSATPERPILLEPSLGIGVAEAMIESSMQETLAASILPEGEIHPEWLENPLLTDTPTAVWPPSSVVYPSVSKLDTEYSYRPRPGLVLDDPEYKPAGLRPLGVANLGSPPSIVTVPMENHHGELFDVTVSAVQRPGGSEESRLTQHTGKPIVHPVEPISDDGGSHQGSAEVITRPQGGQQFVSIDGKRTYINLMGQQTSGPAQPSRPITEGPVLTGSTRPPYPPPSHKQVHIPGTQLQLETPAGVVGEVSPSELITGVVRPSFGGRRPSQPAHPPVRIDTCIVGDATTCDETQYELCRTEHGVSACHCRPGYSRRKHREPCRRIVSMLMSLRVDRLHERRVVWSRDFLDPSSKLYQQLQWEASRAVDSAMSMTPFSDDFLGARVNGLYTAPGSHAPVFINLTLQLEETTETLRPAVRHDVQRHLLGVIHRRANNVGESALWVDAPAGAVSHLEDVDECARPDLHDCHPRAQCSNVFGGFRCVCGPGLRDPWANQPQRAGRACESCPAEHCGGRGTCHYDAQGQAVCTCSGNFYGVQCEVDGEVLGVAVGASVAAVVIIALTLVCLCMWSRRWNREQKATIGSPVFGYLSGGGNGTVKTPAVGGPPYQVSLEDRLRWAQIADVMAQANHYASPLTCHQPEPSGTMPTRPSSAVFGYPAMGSGLTGTMPPPPLPRLGLHGLLPLVPPPAPSTRVGSGARTLENSSTGDDEDRTDLLGRGFQVPRPKSRSSVANQSGIYYDVDYDQNDIYGSKHPSIPLNTYASRGSFHRQ